MNDKIEDFNEYFGCIWALYDTLSTDGYVIVLRDFNGDIGNSLGEKGEKEPNQRGLKLTEFANFFNLCSVNLLKSWKRTTLTVGHTAQLLITFSCPTVCLIIS